MTNATTAGPDGDRLLRARLRALAEAPLLSAGEELSAAATMVDGRDAENELVGLTDAGGRATGLDIDQATELEARVARGEGARRTLIDANRRLVVSIARRHVRVGAATELLLDAGDRALERAADRYDPRGDLAFNAFARWWIEQAMRAVADRVAGPPEAPTDGSATLLTALGQLHAPDRRVLELRLGLTGGRAMSAGEAAQVLGSEPARVEEAEERALAKLRHPCTPGNLRHLRRI